jgi:hypothetical protein
MATLLNKDFVVKAGLVVEGTGTVSSGTVTAGSAQISGGLQVGKNIIVQSTSTFQGTVEARGNVKFNSGLTVIGAITATNIFATINTASNLQGGSAQSIPIQSSTGTTTFIPIGQPYQFLTVSVAGTATWQNFSGSTVGYATTASNLLGGNSGQIPYQNSPGITQFIGTGTSGQVLVSNSGTSAPQFTNRLNNLETITVNTLTVNIFSQFASATFTTLTATNVSIANTLYVGSSTYIAGDLYVDGTQFTVNSDILSSGNKILALSTGSAARRDFADGSGLLVGTADAALAWASLTYGYNSNSWQSNVGLYINTSTQSDATNTGALVVLGGAGINGSLNVGGTATIKNILINSTSNSTASTGVSGALMVAGGVGIAKDLYVGGTSYLNGSIPKISAGVGTFTSLVITGTNVALTVTNSAYIGSTLTVKTLIVTSTLSSLTNTTSNALYIAGGVGISGVLNAGDIYSNGIKVALQASSVSSIIGGTDTAVSTATGAVTIWNTSTLQTVTSRGSTTTNTISINNNTSSTGTNTGALTVVGGVGIGGALYVANTSYIAGAQIVTTATIANYTAKANTSTTSTFLINNTTTSTGTTTGALVVVGGVGIGKDLNIGGNISIGGSFAATQFTGNLLGTASTASNVLTKTVPTGITTSFYITFVQNDYSATTSGQQLYTSNNIQIETDTGYVNIGAGAPGRAQLSIDSSNNSASQITGLKISGPNNNQYSPDINIVRTIDNTGPNYTAYYGANIQLTGDSGGGSKTDAVIQEYQGGLLFYSNGPGQAITNTLLINRTGQLFINYQDANATGPSSLNVSGSGYFTDSVTAQTFNGALNGIASSASSVIIIATNTNAAYYPTLVKQNSQTATNFSLVTTSTLSINPATGVVSVNNSTSATSTTTGALIVTGGAGIAGSLFVGGHLVIGNTTKSFVKSNDFSANLVIVGRYYGNVIGGDPNLPGENLYIISSDTSTTATAIIAFGIYDTTGTNRHGGGILVGRDVSTPWTGGDSLDIRSYMAFLTRRDTARDIEAMRIDLNGNLLIGSTISNYVSSSGVYIAGIAQSTSTNTGALVAVGGAGIGGNLNVGGTVNAANTSYVGGAVIITSATLNSYLQGSGVTSLRAGTDTAVNTSSGIVTIWNTSTLQSITNRGSTTTNTISINTITSSTGTNTGALTVSGGVGIGGALYVANTSYIAGAQILTTATLPSYGVTSINVGTDTAINTSTGSVTIWNTSTLQSITNRGSTTNNIISITNATASTGTTTGALTVAGGLGIGGNLWIGSTISSTSTTTTNALYIAGGLGVAKGINVGATSIINGDLRVTGNITGTNMVVNVISGTSGVFYGDSTGNGALYAGVPSGYTYFPQTMIQASGNFNGYMEINVQNVNNGNQASTDVVASADNVGTSTSYIDMGITNSGWNGSQPYSFGTVLKANDGYLLVSPGSTTATGNLVIGTINTGTSIKFLVAATAAQSTLTTVTASSIALVINPANTNAASTSSSGTLVVYGGVGISGGLYAGGAITATSIFVNGNAVLTSQTIGQYGISNINGSTGSITMAAGTDTAISTTGTTITIWNTSTLQSITNRGSTTTNAISINNTTSSTSTNSGALVVSGGVGIAGNLYVGGTITANIVTIQYTTITTTLVTTDDVISTYNTTASTGTNSGALQVAGGAGIGGALYVANTSYIAGAQILTTATLVNYAVTGITAGTDTSVSTSTGAVTIWNTSTLQSVTNRGSTTNNAISITSTATSTGTNTGALTVVGGVGIGGVLYVANTSYIAGAQILTTATIVNFGVSKLTAGTDTAISSSTGAVTIWNTSTLQTVTDRGSITTNAMSIKSTASSTSTNTGALTVSGGVGIGGGVYVGGSITATNYYVTGGSLVFSGNISAPAWTTSGIRHVSIPATLTDTSSTGTVANAYSNAFGGNTIAAANTVTFTNYSTMFVNAPTAGTNVTITNSYSIIAAGSILINNTASSTNTSTGALQVAGGVGIGGALYIANASYVNGAQILTTATISSFGVTSIAAGTDTVVSSSTGVVTIWNTSTLQSVTNRGSTTTNAISINTTTSSTGTNTGALTVSGGVGIGGALYVANTSYIAGARILTTTTGITSIVAGTDTAVSTSTGDITIWNTSTLQSVTNRGSTTTNAISINTTTPSTNPTTGALTVVGGVGIGGTVYIGNQTTGTVNALAYGSALLATINISLNTTTQTIVDSFSTSTYRSAKYFCQITSGTTNVHLTELSVFHANNTTYINEYGINTNNGVLGSYDANISNGNVNLLFTPNSSTTVVLKMTRDTILI